MRWRHWIGILGKFVQPGLRRGQSRHVRSRGQVTHVLILDGTMSSLMLGCESNAGLLYRLLSEVGDPGVSVFYEAGLQWQDWRATKDVMTGRGINRQICRAYGYLASRYKPGDRIFLFGYSRGAFAARSLAGAVDQVGLLKAEHATERNVQLAYRHYKTPVGSPAAAVFRAAHCHEDAQIEMVGVWDTVKALGMRLPVLWQWSEEAHSFHNHKLGPAIRRGYHALALDETRAVFEPVLWKSPDDYDGHVEQVWFRGTHGDVGGQLGGYAPSRPLANIPLVWMLEHTEANGLSLPEGWMTRFPRNVDAPSVGSWSGWGKMFLLRKPRVIGRDPSERLHESVGRADVEMPRAEPVH